MMVRYRLFIDGAPDGGRFEDIELAQQKAEQHISAGSRCIIEAFASPVKAWGYRWNETEGGWVTTDFPQKY